MGSDWLSLVGRLSHDKSSFRVSSVPRVYYMLAVFRLSLVRLAVSDVKTL